MTILSVISLHTETKPRRRKQRNDDNIFTREKLASMQWRAFDNKRTVCRLSYIILYVIIMVALIKQFN